MGKLCIIGFDDNKVIKDFIRLHVEKLAGEKVCLSGSYPDYRHQSRFIRYFHSRRPLRQKLAKLLPHVIYQNRILAHQQSFERAVDAMAGFCQAHQVEVILAEFGDQGEKIAPLAEALSIPLVVHFHGHDAHRESFLTDSRREAYQQMFRYSHAVLGVSRHMMTALAALGCDESKLIYNPYGPRDSFFQIEPRYEPVVLSVGRFTDIKANYLVLLAFSKALENAPQGRLVMVGDGELLETCKTMAKVLGIADRVEFKGAIPHQEVVHEFKQACCFAQHSVTPSYGDAEGTPNTILEAAAAALPIVSTRHAGIKDVVVEGKTGLLVDELDVDGMASHLAALLNDPARCRTMGARSRQHIRENFSSDQHIARLQAAIDSARASLA